VRIDAVLDRGDFREDRDRDLRWRAAADEQTDRAVKPRDLLGLHVELDEPLAALGVVGA